VGAIVMWKYRKRFEALPKKYKEIQKEVGGPPIRIFRRLGEGIFPIKLLKRGEIPKNSKRVYPKMHPGGRKSGTPYDEIDRLVIDKICNDRNLNTIQAIRIFLPQYKKKFLEMYSNIETVYKSDEDLIIDSARKRISELLEKTTLIS
jgi:hypothetical protein